MTVRWPPGRGGQAACRIATEGDPGSDKEIRMSLADRFRRQPANRSNQPAAEQAPKPKRLRLAGQILRDDIFPTSTTNEQ